MDLKGFLYELADFLTAQADSMHNESITAAETASTDEDSAKAVEIIPEVVAAAVEVVDAIAAVDSTQDAISAAYAAADAARLTYEERLAECYKIMGGKK